MFYNVIFQPTLLLLVWLFSAKADDVSEALGPCTCDLMVSRCDINCCCDTDCTSTDKKIFSQCVDAIGLPVTIGCNKINFSDIAKISIQTTTTSADSILCVSMDNYPKRNNYTTPSLVSTTTSFDTLAKTFRNNVFNISIPSFTGSSTNLSIYQKGDPIYLLYTLAPALSRLTLPKAVGGSFCNYNTIASYLTNDSTSCIRALTTTACQSITFFNHETYKNGICVLPSSKYVPKYLSGSTTITQQDCANYDGAKSIDTVCTNLAGAIISCTAPNNLGGFCNNIVTEVSYEVTYSSKDGIQQVKAQIKLGSGYNTDITQKFSINFVSATYNASGVARSGNPGYLPGYPLLVGSFNKTNNNKTVTNLQPWTVPSGGDCLSTARTTVLFGQNIRSGCIYKISDFFGSNCSAVQSNIRNFLNGTSFQNTGTMRVAFWGNASASLPDDWLEFSEDPDTSDSTGDTTKKSCSNLIVGANVQIFYARVGVMSYPQNKVVRISHNFVRGNVKYVCIGTPCSTQNVEITISINFIDTSVSTTSREKQIPVFLSRLPYDFFYPFFV